MNEGIHERDGTHRGARSRNHTRKRQLRNGTT
jgi:hypothetical protein